MDNLENQMPVYIIGGKSLRLKEYKRLSYEEDKKIMGLLQNERGVFNLNDFTKIGLPIILESIDGKTKVTSKLCVKAKYEQIMEIALDYRDEKIRFLDNVTEEIEKADILKQYKNILKGSRNG